MSSSLNLDLEKERRLYFGQPLKTFSVSLENISNSGETENIIETLPENNVNRTRNMVEAFERTLLKQGILASSTTTSIKMSPKPDLTSKSSSKVDAPTLSSPTMQQSTMLDEERLLLTRQLLESQNKVMELTSRLVAQQVRLKETEDQLLALTEKQETHSKKHQKDAATTTIDLPITLSGGSIDEESLKREIALLKSKLAKVQLDWQESQVTWKKERLDLMSQIQCNQPSNPNSNPSDSSPSKRDREKDLLARLESLVQENCQLRKSQARDLETRHQERLDLVRSRESCVSLQERLDLLQGRFDRLAERETILQQELRKCHQGSDQRDRKMAELQHQMYQMSVELKTSLYHFVNKNKPSK